MNDVRFSVQHGGFGSFDGWHGMGHFWKTIQFQTEIQLVFALNLSKPGISTHIFIFIFIISIVVGT